MLDKLFAKFRLFSLKDWLNVFLWFSAFVLLITFVIVSATMAKGTDDYANALAIIGVLFGLSIVSGLFMTATLSYLKGKRGVN